MIKLFYFKQFNLACYLFALSLISNNAIYPFDKTLSGATTQSQSGHGNDGNEGILHIPQSSSIGLFNVYQDTCCECPYPAEEMQSMYSTAPANWAEFEWNICI